MSSVSSAVLVAVFAGIVAVPVGAVTMRAGRYRPVVHLTAPPMTVREIAPDPQTLRVCADPNNLPFSNERGEGFENAIAGLVARELHRRLEYFWLPQRRGFVRNSLRVGVCDLIIGVPAQYDLVRTTHPYYRSTYVFVSRRGAPRVHSFDDPVLRHQTIGIQITGDDYQNPPAAEALAVRNLAANVRGYPVYGDYSQPDPQRTVIDDVGSGRIDTAVVWGPIAGYFARRAASPLAIAAVTPARDPDAGPFTFDIAMGVRRDDAALQRRLDEVIARRRADMQRILRQFGVPLVGAGAGS
jgi:mxaJ protein